MALETVDLDELSEVESNTKSKGQYKAFLTEFLASNTKAAKLAATEGGAKANSIKTGFNSAIEALKKEDGDSAAQYVTTKIYKDAVYLVRSDVQ